MNKSLKITKTFGAEIEKAVSSLKNFQSVAVSQFFFKRINEPMYVNYKPHSIILEAIFLA